jgi:hypothetical protein
VCVCVCVYECVYVCVCVCVCVCGRTHVSHTIEQEEAATAVAQTSCVVVVRAYVCDHNVTIVQR